jgi:hypothetical protein
MRQTLTADPLHIRGCEPGDIRAVRRPHDDVLNEVDYSALRPDTTVQQRAAQRLYLKYGYSEAGRGVVGPFDCNFYEREILG